MCLQRDHVQLHVLMGIIQWGALHGNVSSATKEVSHHTPVLLVTLEETTTVSPATLGHIFTMASASILVQAGIMLIYHRRSV